MLRLLSFLCLFYSVFALNALTGRKADRFLVVQFSKTMEPYILDELTAYTFDVLEPLNVEKTLYKAGYDSKRKNELEVADVLRKLPSFMSSEVDIPVRLRSTTPNDTLFGKQWHLNLIRATQAWDSLATRSGLNRRGDTIVIAVIDDGLYIKHPDFKGNIWINYADTINNGKDDDSNGYVDDTYGWNFVKQNNDISDSFYYKSGHGSPVAGIIGARTNNITGVSGIMWNVKLMIVNIADTSLVLQTYQSDALRAYSYVLHQRKIYNASGGTKGAFVVASNSSWGADNAKPNQTPLWCAMYDSLGKYGVLNVNAVTNAYVPDSPVEITGDIPTLCPSIHLIAVGSTNSTDGFFNCGYSTTHVDLSAPGSNIFSTNAYTPQNIANNRIFGNGHAGTSFAAPMVTAAIGILHAYACERVLDSIKSNPAKGNLILRKFILEGVDVLPALNGKSVTSGRLNILKSMQIMDLYCQGIVSVDPVIVPHKISIFPNPGNGKIYIASEKPVNYITCYDITGKTVSVQFDGEQLDLGSVEDGVYFIRIEVDGEMLTCKYVKTGSF